MSTALPHTPFSDPFGRIDRYRPHRVGVPSAWFGHVPFGYWLTGELKPELLVELGTHSGVSFSSFCDAVLESELTTTCFAVDTWQGDPQAGAYGEEVWLDWYSFNRRQYGDFSHLLRETFDEAVVRFEDGSIDLLHIDGLHTYEAVRNDVDRWLPRMSERGVVIMHDIAERDADFGVWRVWEELRSSYPTFDFHHEHGLGVVATGSSVPECILHLTEADDVEAARIRARFAAAGERLRLEEELAGVHRQLGLRDGSLSEAAGRISQLEEEIERLRGDLALVERDRDAFRDQSEELRASTSWRLSAPVRVAGSVVGKLKGR